MTVFEVLKQASQIVSALIGEKTPPIFETLRKAYVDLGELVSCAQKMDEITPEFARGMSDLVARLEVFKASHAAGESKVEPETFTVEQFVEYFKVQVGKALEEPPARSLQRLYAFKAGITKALGDQYAGPGNDTSIRLVVFVDPWQQASVEREGNAAPTVTSGTAQQGEVKGTPGLSIDDVLKSVHKAVETASVTPFSIEVGWSNDLASKEFLHGQRTWDFGADGQKG